jgi:hypothetical protein
LSDTLACEGQVAKVPHRFYIALARCFSELGGCSEVVSRLQGTQAAFAGIGPGGCCGDRRLFSGCDRRIDLRRSR